MKINRNTDLAKIHLAKKDLQIDDDQYRDILWTLCRVKTSADLDAYGRAKVLQYFRQLGWKSKPPKNRGRKPGTLEREPYLQKIGALLADMGLSWTYAESIAWRVTGGKGQQPTSEQPGVEKLEWVKQQRHFRAIVTALVKEQHKRKLRNCTTESTEGTEQ